MKKILWLAFNAKFSHTSLAARYLRQAAAEINIESELLELTINNYIPDILSEVYDHKPDILGISCYIWNIELVKQVLPLVRKVLPELPDAPSRSRMRRRTSETFAPICICRILWSGTWRNTPGTRS